MILGLVLSSGPLLLPLPWKLVTLGGVALTLVFAVIIFVRTARRRGSFGPLVIALIGAGMAAFSAVVVIAQIVFWDQTAAFEQCMSEALTDSAVARCEAEFTDGLGR